MVVALIEILNEMQETEEDGLCVFTKEATSLSIEEGWYRSEKINQPADADRKRARREIPEYHGRIVPLRKIT